MRIAIVAVLAAGLTLSGCSSKTGEAAETAVENAASDTASNLEVASSKVSEAASDLGDDNETSATSETTTTSDGTATTTTTTEQKTY